MKKTLVSLVMTGAVVASAAGGGIRFQSGEKQVSLVELYTSEGCSSCPPAEAWLGRLKDSAELWKSFAPISFHVDYWNSLGWKDRWSSAEFTERQRAYAEAWKSDNIYTPCFALNGKEWHGWVIGRQTPPASGEDVGVLAVSSADTNRWTASFIPALQPDVRYQIHAALLAGGLNSDVQAGENTGRHLRHEFTVLSLVEIGMISTNGAARGRFISDIMRYNANSELAIAVWVTCAGQLEPIQATGGWLRPPRGTAK
jgi:hypothetical protein